MTAAFVLPNAPAGLSLVAAVLAILLGGASLVQRRRSPASWCFFAGMMVFGAEMFLQAACFRGDGPAGGWQWMRWKLTASALLPALWLPFSVIYARGNYREFLVRWRPVLLVLPLLAAALAIYFGPALVQEILAGPQGAVLIISSAGGKGLQVLLLVSYILILANFERTFGLAVGVMRWRIKFLLLGLGLVFGVRLYTSSQMLLFPGFEVSLLDLDAAALLISSAMISVAHLRRGLSEAEVYPSYAFLQNSVTVLLAGIYLFAVGVLAHIARVVGGNTWFQVQALVVLAGVAGLGLLLFSEQIRQRLRNFVSRHLRRSQHDFRKVWRQMTEGLAAVQTAPEISGAGARLVSETFNALSVTVWLTDRQNRWLFGGSTSQVDGRAIQPAAAVREVVSPEVMQRSEPFDLEEEAGADLVALRAATPGQFSRNRRFAVGLKSNGRFMGLLVLGDRVDHASYTVEERELLKCMADQLAASLLCLELRQQVAAAQELQTFQTMSAFFVHDLKNSAASLNLMIQNLPEHFENPEFRKDALRGVQRAADRINTLVVRLSSFREELELDLRTIDLNEMVCEAVGQLGCGRERVQQDLQLDRPVRIDREHFRSVLANLLMNAHEATPVDGRISVRTEALDEKAILTVADSGCGMSQEFLDNSLFRPFRTTKKKGIGIGMFQSRMIVDAHCGQIQVDSEPGKGATFRVILPLSNR